MPDTLTIALSKGRILKETLPLLQSLGIVPDEDPIESRRLIVATSQRGVRLVIVRAADVPTYVEYGAADLGVAGKDLLLEYQGDGIYEPLDLGIARCRLMLAGRPQAVPVKGRLRVASKYVKTTRAFFADKGRQVEVIKLYGSMELAPVLGLADQIVDLVDTGKTLQANGLVALEKLVDISARLIVNKAALKMKQSIIQPILEQLGELVKST